MELNFTNSSKSEAHSAINLSANSVIKWGSVQESDRARDFSGVGFTANTGAVAVVAVGMWKPRVWCGLPSSVGRTTTLR